MVKQNNRARIARQLTLGDQTIGQLSEALSLGKTTTWRWLQIMVCSGEAHIFATTTSAHGGRPMPLYRAGSAHKSFKPKKHVVKSPKQITDKYRKKLRETGDWDDVLARQRAYYWSKKKVTRDPLTAAFFGSAQ